jgi:hypothetical protein
VTTSQLVNGPLLVFDATVLHHFALADRLDVLASIVIGRPCATTAVVLDELRAAAAQNCSVGRALELDWMQVLPLDTPVETRCFAGLGPQDRRWPS